MPTPNRSQFAFALAAVAIGVGGAAVVRRGELRQAELEQTEAERGEEAEEGSSCVGGPLTTDDLKAGKIVRPCDPLQQEDLFAQECELDGKRYGLTMLTESTESNTFDWLVLFDGPNEVARERLEYTFDFPGADFHVICSGDEISLESVPMGRLCLHPRYQLKFKDEKLTVLDHSVEKCEPAPLPMPTTEPESVFLK